MNIITSIFDRVLAIKLFLHLERERSLALKRGMSLQSFVDNCQRANLDLNDKPRSIVSELLQCSEHETHVCRAVKLLAQGNVIALPTDSVYGLACAVQDTTAVENLYKIKGRDLSKPFAICVSSVEEIDEWADTTVIPPNLLHSILPGPYTIVIRRTDKLNPAFNPGIRTVGVRIPQHDFVLDIVKRFGKPLALTSANSSGDKSSIEVEEFAHLWPKISAIFDGGRIASNLRIGSTVVDLSEKGRFRIIREGMAQDSLRNKLESFGLTENIANLLH